MRTKTIVVLPYQESWPQAFFKITAELREAVGNLVLRFEHVGSTSVPGLAAKPIIDIDAVIADSHLLNPLILRLANAGYIHEGNLGIAGREAFRYTDKPHLLQHHLYVCPKDSPELKRHLAFREYLRAHPDAVAAYSRVKMEAARLYPTDIDAYCLYKAPCIEKLYREAGIS
ncbi:MULTISPECIES: GrpB family protein [Caproicibacterium]|uniref:GrpB family protein n=1 Tax=Caproicibacterium argilliputei TaxID=3030016 RepID=A0AA97D948_9FIRM|nr:GrpB family protein [Caproicibacterium argilliputei]WOC31977.1 GrpB family protein [Caproicibacterium argilliputei]